ncbi:MAG: FGGY-family carbohydrate kinase, partial [Thermomicrobiales bacterium]
VMVTGAPKPNPLVWATGYTFPGVYDIAFGMATSGALTRWFKDELAGGELVAEASGGLSAYASLAEQAASIPSGSEGLICLPYFSGERTPINDPDARGMFAGLSLTHTRAHLYRALLEGPAYGARHNLETIASIGAEVKRMIAVGGGVKNPLWLQIVSNVTGMAQIVPERSIGASLGDAFLAGIAAGIVPSIDALNRDWVKPKLVVEPDYGQRAIYDEYYPIYRSLYEDSKHSLHALARLGTPAHA